MGTIPLKQVSQRPTLPFLIIKIVVIEASFVVHLGPFRKKRHTLGMFFHVKSYLFFCWLNPPQLSCNMLAVANKGGLIHLIISFW